jgi:hypothetical protein
LRQRRYRERQRQRERQRELERQRQEEIVTHQGSQEPCANDVLESQASEQPNVSPMRKPMALVHCHWCKRALTGELRRSFLHHSAFEDPLANWMKGVTHGQSP